MKRARAALIVLVTVVMSSVSLASAASAYGGETGYLLIHGPGTTYAGPGSYNNVTTTAGGTGTFMFEVKNTGVNTAQFLLRSYDSANNCASCAPAKVVATPGSADTAAAMQGPVGYFTPPIAAGKTLAFTMKVTPPAWTPAGTVFDVSLFLYDSGGSSRLSEAFAYTTITRATGAAGYDQFVTGAGGQKPVRETAPDFAMVNDPSAEPGAVSVFTVKLQNDSTAPDQIHYDLLDYYGCGAAFPAKVKAGTTDITDAVENSTYWTPVLAPGKSTTLTVAVTAAGPLSQCYIPSTAAVWLGTSYSTASTGHDQAQQVFLMTNPVAS